MLDFVRTLRKRIMLARPRAHAMGPSPSNFLLGSEFDAFLFASVGDDRNGLPFSIVSLLGRMDLDPWAGGYPLGGSAQGSRGSEIGVAARPEGNTACTSTEPICQSGRTRTREPLLSSLCEAMTPVGMALPASELVISDFIAEELGRKLRDKFNFPESRSSSAARLLGKNGDCSRPDGQRPPRTRRVSGHRHNQAGRILATDNCLRGPARSRLIDGNGVTQSFGAGTGSDRAAVGRRNSHPRGDDSGVTRTKAATSAAA